MDGLLRKKDVVEAVGVPKSTVSDWITNFSPFIPKVKNGSTVYYKPEAIEVLLTVKELRAQDYDMSQISLELTERGFPVDAETVSDEVKTTISRAEKVKDRDALLTVMSTMGKAMERMTELEKLVAETKAQQLEQEKINEQLKEKIEEQKQYISDRIEERDAKLMTAIRELQDSRKQVAAEVDHEKKRSFFSRLFGR
ncbi:DNA-binding transcriptional MerR regulator [Scopulibacillus daqui]|uniref:DNA-binding transcriptional MerR regulator n=1 Tax=Scopulibacillus daqui TaxID=1469162 RepID=A0ABS2Q413_9BACL|nr:DNA-binding transcriptional MerR regulator [Scopulibacillus daqui]